MAVDIYPETKPRPRARLAAVLQAAKDLVTIDHAVTALGVNRTQAAKLLARWQQQGWLKRVGRGVYAPIPLDAMSTEQVLTDPWVLVPARFDPAYIGGWTAAEHWNMTEQLFRSVFVFTARPIRSREVVIQGVPFTLRHIKKAAIFGTRTLWRGRTRVAISDKHRTIVDVLADPATGGGLRHVTDCLQHYLADPESDPQTLIRYAETLGNGAVFKRLGFLASQWPGHDLLVEACRQRLTQGNARLDPAQPCRRLIKAWRLWVPKTWAKSADHD
jgi:predicted transcriptional regulator of viral defense system